MGSEFIVMVKVDDRYSFYICDEPDVWVTDNAGYAQAFIDAGYDLSYVPDDHERSDTGILTKTNITKFLDKISSQKLEVSFLNELIVSQLPTDNWYDIAALIPQVIYDFDTNKYCSYHEQHIFDKFIPSCWTSDNNLLDNISNELKYWVVNGENLFEKCCKET